MIDLLHTIIDEWTKAHPHPGYEVTLKGKDVPKKFDGYKLCDNPRCYERLSSEHYVMYDKRFFCSQACTTAYIDQQFKKEQAALKDVHYGKMKA